MRYDAAAERFAAAVTLYEMATGKLPRWGNDANPAAISDEVTLDPAGFEPVLADRLIAFFERALARDATARFGTVDDMADAWRAMFKDLPKPDPDQPSAGPSPASLDRDSPLTATSLTARARSALDRLGIHTVGELLGSEPSALTRAKGVPDATRKEILAQIRTLRGQIPVPAPGPAMERAIPRGVEAAVLLGQEPGNDGRFLCWPSQTEGAAATGLGQPQVSTLLRKWAREWLGNEALHQVRDELVALLDNRGTVMSATELAEAFLAARGSYSEEPKRTAQAVGLVHAAVEAELARGGDARVAMYRLRDSGAVLVGREPDDPEAETTAAQRLAYAVRLGRAAADLARQDPLPTRQRALETLRAIAAPDDMPTVDDQRLLRLAAEASGDKADVNAQGQFYPVGMPAQRALELAMGSIAGQRLAPDQIQARVRARFPRAKPVPPRPELTDLLAAVGTPLAWEPTQGVYAPPSLRPPTSTRMVSVLGPLAGPEAVSDVDAKLTAALRGRGFLALLAPLTRLQPARRALLARHRLTEVDVTAVMLTQLRALGFPWEVVVAADSGDPASPDFRGLADLVRHQVVPAVAEALAVDTPVLITEAAPLARYGQLRILQELADPTRLRPAARFLLVPARQPDPARLDSVQLPLTSPASQSLWLPPAWITPTVETTAR